ncbi:hypothetical protein O7627_36800 [Solwaraspora sp. WMMD1047]|uniref:hypothetical protein n=1 Tax=Solwaraspora sp. WMMD1047 TaxID=3016102 RepID=UPI0024180DB8|nr:hypothetical protein [Solwaraspora sp. WMMD1047]MDG4834830.1 hypothetical protein [Solwaraspora sp. WMMD1047]
MAAKPAWKATVAITSSHWIRQELHQVELHAGCEFEFTASVPDGRRNTGRRPIVILGADLVGRVRKPISCGGFVVVAALDVAGPRTFSHAARISASYVIALPSAREWLAYKLMRIKAD